MEDAVDHATRSAMQTMLGGYRVSQMIAVAAKLRVADHLKDGPKTVRDLARATDSCEDALYRLLRTLACMGVFALPAPRLSAGRRRRWWGVLRVISLRSGR